MTATEVPRMLARALVPSLVMLAFSSSVFAQATAANARAAQLLFDEAKRLADDKNYTAACPKFVQSHQLDPAGGTILHAADCHEHEHKLASAWAEYNEALSFAIKTNRADRESIARARIDALAPKLAKLHVKVPPASRALDDFGIWLDGTQVAGKRLGDAPIPVDAGSHVVEARAPGHVTLTQQFVIVDGKELVVSFDDLVADPSAAVAPATPKSSVARDDDRGRLQRTAGIALLGAGGVGLVLGTIFGVRALAIGDQSDQCTLGPRGNGCPSSAVDDQNSARTSGTISSVGFVAGGLLAAGGAVLFFTAPKPASARGGRGIPRVGLGGHGLSLAVSGEF